MVSRDMHNDATTNSRRRTITTTMFMTLDGVVQGLGRADEDTRGGFTHGGWGPRYNDDVMVGELGKEMSSAGDLLFGRRTWQDFAEHWGRATDDNPYSAHLNAAEKYVVSHDELDVGLWQNSTLLRGEAAVTVAALKAQPGPDLSINGSATLVRSLHAAGLIDQYTLLIHPLTLGSGTTLFDGPLPPAELVLRAAVTTTTGVIIARYSRV